MARSLTIPAKLIAALVVALLLVGALPSAAFAATPTTLAVDPVGAVANGVAASITAKLTNTATGAGLGGQQLTFTVKDGATTIGSPVTQDTQTTGGANVGKATAAYPIPAGTPGGVYTVQVSYAGNGVLDPATNSTQTVTVRAPAGAGTVTTATSAVQPGSTGNRITFVYTVPAGGMNTGSIGITVPTGWSAPTTSQGPGRVHSTAGTVSISSGTIQVSALTLNAGQTVSVTYGHNGGHAQDTGATAPATAVGNQTWTTSSNPSAATGRAELASSPVIRVASATTLEVTPVVATYRGEPDLTAQLTPAAAGKTITFSLNGTEVGTADTNASGVATLVDAALGTIAVGPYPAGVAASFAGDGGLNPSSDDASLTVQVRTVPGSFTVENKVYDQSAAATVIDRSLINKAGGDVTLVGGTAAFEDAAAGTGKTVTLTGATLGGTEAANYTLGVVSTATANITKAPVTGAFTADDKTYDGTTAATILTTDVDGELPGDTVTLDDTAATATFANKNVGTGKTVSGTGFTLGGTHAANYSLGTVSDATADITARALTVTATADNKQYDGTDEATATLDDDRVDNDLLDLDYDSATFADKFVGTGKTVTVSGIAITGGADADNYNLLNTSDTDTADIAAPDQLTVTFTADDKDYDGTTAATGTFDLIGEAPGDDVQLTGGSMSFAGAGVGSHDVTLSGLSLTGDDADTYQLATTSVTDTASIDPRELTGSFTADDKVYDGTTAASILTYDVTNEVTGEDVNITGGTATFADPNVANGITVSGTGFTLTGDDKDNYSLGTVGDTAADITAATVTATFTAANKVYDGATNATISGSQITGGVVGDEDVTLVDGAAAFDNKDVGTGKTVTGTGFDIAGADVGNYVLAAVPTTTADITAIQLTASFTADNKVYDGTDAATILSQPLSAGVLDGEDVSLTAGTATFADKHVGTAKTVTATGIALTGADAGNYELGAIPTTTADIAVADLTPTATVTQKRYDGDSSVPSENVELGDDRVSGDDVVLTFTSAAFDDELVGDAKPVTVSGIAIDSGADAGNYQLTTDTVATTSNIVSADGILVTFTAIDKVYDGTTAATREATVTLDPAPAAGDDVTVTGGTLTFDDKAVGTAQAVTWDGFALSGADAGNYTLASTSATDTADITRRDLDVTASAADKAFDGTTAATVDLDDNRVAGDMLTVSYASAQFDTADIGLDKTVNVTGISIDGLDAGNYTLANDSTTATADITEPVVVATKKAYRSDGMIKKPSSSYSGNNVYNRTGRNQTKETRARRGQSRVFYVRVQNDPVANAAAQRLRLDGCASTAGFKVAYFANGNRVTQKVADGSYRTALLGKGAFRTIKMVITPTRSARIGATMGCALTVFSTRESTGRTSPTLDVVRAKVTKRR